MMRAILVTAAMLSIAGQAAAQRAPRITYQEVPTTVTVTTTNWQNGPYPQPQPYDRPYIPYGEVPVDANVFAGVRLEAQVGYDVFRNRGDGLIFGSGTKGRDGVVYGGEAGLDLPLGRSAVLGGYVGLEGTSVDPCYAVIGATLCATPKLSFTAGGRIGVALGRGTLLYAKGGYTRGRVRVTLIDTVIPADSFRSTGNLDGFHVGAGLETGFGGRAYGKLEYVYTRFGSFSDEDRGIDDEDTNLDRHQVKVGVGLRL